MEAIALAWVLCLVFSFYKYCLSAATAVCAVKRFPMGKRTGKCIGTYFQMKAFLKIYRKKEF